MNSLLTHLECSVCGDRHSPHKLQSVCRTCGKALCARYDLVKGKQMVSREWFQSASSTFWNYAPFLPVEKTENVVSLGEPMTPVLRLTSMEKTLGLSAVFIKDESRLPTGSFKARGLALAVSKAKELGVSTLCIPSAGNAAGALAAYAARGGLNAQIFIPNDTPEINIAECKASGANVVLVSGTIADAAKAMNQEKKDHPDWFDVSTLKEPYRLEGKKTMGYELAVQFEWQLPDVIVYPAGGGTGLIGMWKAFGELETLGLIGKERPRMIAVQSDGCAPIVKAFEQRQPESQAWPNARTIASGLRVPKAFADYMILDAIYSSNGHAIAVKDEEILQAVATVARGEGLYCCPEGAATVVALKKMSQRGLVKQNETVLLFNTAAGNKYPELIMAQR
ncbi:MAG: threonine synthase [Bacteroidota bacterium]